MEVITETVKAGSQRTVRRHLGGLNKRTSWCDTSIRTKPEALLRLIRQRWSTENEWHWARDAQLGEDAPLQQPAWRTPVP